MNFENIPASDVMSFRTYPGMRFGFGESAQLNPRPGGVVVPIEFDKGWRAETNSWKLTAYLGANLCGAPTYKISGPDAVRFLSDHFVNGVTKFPVGTGRHGIMCRDDGVIMADGVIIRTGDEEFITYWMAPYVQYVLEAAAGRYDARGEQLTNEVFLYQLAGPRSLEILEAAAKEDVHDLNFMNHRLVHIAGHEVRILRLGMSGTLGYEIHGPNDAAASVYDALWEAGKAFGLVKLGHRAYMMNHTENGFPQAFYHFPYPWYEDDGFIKWAEAHGDPGASSNRRRLSGSMGNDISLRVRTPYDNGWGRVVCFNHEFTGSEALKRIKERDEKRMVTLKWNVDDILDVYRSQFEPGEHYAPMDPPNDRWYSGPEEYHADEVVNAAGERVGVSSGRCYSYYFRDMISLCCIDREYAGLGAEVCVVWGEPGTRQKRIRATVERFPYLDQGRNESIGTSHIPHFEPAK